LLREDLLKSRQGSEYKKKESKPTLPFNWKKGGLTQGPEEVRWGGDWTLRNPSHFPGIGTPSVSEWAEKGNEQRTVRRNEKRRIRGAEHSTTLLTLDLWRSRRREQARVKPRDHLRDSLPRPKGGERGGREGRARVSGSTKRKYIMKYGSVEKNAESKGGREGKGRQHNGRTVLKRCLGGERESS